MHIIYLKIRGGAIAEVSGTMHKNNHKVLHINYNTKSPTRIDRNKFDSWREGYWKERAKNYQR
ncbi:hypothetical protein BHC44_10810 [Snodgrassella alvi]|nr:hypothetical protein BHC44_10810 [Snodgrassella alvi]